MKKVLSVLTIAGLLLVPLTALAADPLSLASESNQDALKHNKAGIANYQQGQYAEALKYFEESEKIQRTAEVYFNEALAYDQLGRSGKARMHFQEAQRLEQENALRQSTSPISNAKVLQKYHLLQKQ